MSRPLSVVIGQASNKGVKAINQDKLLIVAIDVLHNAFSVPVASLLLMVSV